MPQARPSAMAVKTAAISLALPGADRKRTREKVPATATPAPMLPLTIMITVLTTAGSRASAAAKLRVQRFFLAYTKASSAPRASAEDVRSRNSGIVRDSVLLLYSPVK